MVNVWDTSLDTSEYHINFAKVASLEVVSCFGDSFGLQISTKL